MNTRRGHSLSKWGLFSLVLALLLAASALNVTATDPGNPGVYTLDADFDQGVLVNVNHDAPNSDQLQLDSQAEPFDFIWIAASARGTIIKIDTNTGDILGEYWSAPQGRPNDPSRTTVDGNGNVWSGNRAESSGGKGSVVHVGLLENGQCVDRNGNGVIDTSSGLGDIKDWPNDGDADTDGGVSTAADECIIHFVRTAGTNVRTLAVDANNDVWVGGSNSVHQLHDGSTGAPIGTAFNSGCGGYGGLIDRNGVLWSARFGSALLRYVPGSPDPGTGAGSCIPVSNGYGLGRDGFGNIWHSQWTNGTITKYDPNGVSMGTYNIAANSGSRGVVATADNNIWVANSNLNNVTRLNNAGVVQASVAVGTAPTGVAVDGAGKVWVTNLGSDDARRIDPTTDAVDLTVSLGDGAGPYNYSDMTGSTLIAPPNTGTWFVVHDTTIPNAVWGYVTWTADTPGDSSLTVAAASSADGVTFSSPQAVTNGVDLTVPDGQYLKVTVTFQRATTGESPVLYDLTILANQPPDCTDAVPSQDTIWPPNHKWVPIDVLGVTDPDGDAVTINIDSIYQDEPVDTYGDGSFTPDGQGVGTPTAEVRAERAGTKKVPGDGRVYHVSFTAADPYGYTCSGEVLVGVPHDRKDTPVDGGALYDSTALWP